MQTQSDTIYKPLPKFVSKGKDASLKFEEQVIGYQANAPFAVPLSMIVIVSMNAYFAHDAVSPVYWMPWLIIAIALIIFRVLYLAQIHKSTKLSIQAKLNRCIVMGTINGCVHASALIFFPFYNFAERSILSLVLLGLISGAIVTTHGYRKIFLPNATIIIVGMTLFWAFTPLPEVGLVGQFGVAGLILIFFATQISTSKRYLEAVQQAFAAREEHVDLNARLNAELKSSLDKEEQLTELNQKLNSALDDAVSASESKTRFLALASHDLRQPIHTLSLFSAALSLRPLDEKSSTIASRMETAVGNLASQMDSLLDISKLDAGMVDPNFADIDLVSFLERMTIEYRNIAQEEGLKFNFSSSVKNAAITSDPELFERIIRNLLGNAIKYTDIGTINLNLEQDKDSPYWQITISDTGRGISEADKAKIFEEFYQVANPERNRMKGLGLGLAIVKRLTTLLSIELEFDSNIGKGTSFSLKMPMTEAADFHENTEIVIPSISGLSIICVDDEIAIREAIEDLLGAMDCKVFTCRGTAEAVVLAKQMSPDALLADFRLIGDDSGLKTINAVREIHPNLPAILVSGDTAPERLKQARDADVPMLHKPVSAEKLQIIIAEIVNT